MFHKRKRGCEGWGTVREGFESLVIVETRDSTKGKTVVVKPSPLKIGRKTTH